MKSSIIFCFALSVLLFSCKDDDSSQKSKTLSISKALDFKSATIEFSNINIWDYTSVTGSNPNGPIDYKDSSVFLCSKGFSFSVDDNYSSNQSNYVVSKTSNSVSYQHFTYESGSGNTTDFTFKLAINPNSGYIDTVYYATSSSHYNHMSAGSESSSDEYEGLALCSIPPIYSSDTLNIYELDFPKIKISNFSYSHTSGSYERQPDYTNDSKRTIGKLSDFTNKSTIKLTLHSK